MAAKGKPEMAASQPEIAKQLENHFRNLYKLRQIADFLTEPTRLSRLRTKMKPFYAMNEAELVNWSSNATEMAGTYTAELFPGAGGAAELEAFEEAGNAFIAAKAAQLDAEAAAKNATVAKNEAKAAWLGLVGPYNNEWQLSSLVTESIRTKMQLPVRQGPGSITAPVTPTDVVVTPNANGTVDAKWKRNGNSAQTTFIIERQMGSTWSGVFAGTGTKAHMSGFTPGVPAIFRIRAVKGQVSSAPTPTFSIYSEGEGETLQLAA